MDPGRVFPLYFILATLSLVRPSDGQDNKNVTAEPGQNEVTLPCVGVETKPVMAVEWWRMDLGEQEYVLRHRDGQLDDENQHPSFKDRVSLLDGEVKKADVSLVLRNVTADDEGTYECWVIQRGMDGSNPDRKLIRTVYLGVAPPPGNQDGSRKQETKDEPSPGHIGLIAAVVFLVLFICTSGLVLLCIRLAVRKTIQTQGTGSSII